MAQTEATNRDTGLIVRKGDKVVVKAQGILVRGVVATVSWLNSYPGDPGGWQMEIDEANVPGGWSHWKQWQDGGYLAEVNGVVIQA